KLKENGAKFATEYIAQMKKATDLPEAFWAALEAQMTAKFANLGKTAGKANLAALKEIFASIPKEIQDLEKTIPTVKIVDYEKQKKELQKTIDEIFVLTQDSKLFKDSGKSVDELKEALIKFQTEALKKLIIGFGEAKEEALDMSKAFERLKKTVADQEELKALELKVRKIKELGSVKKAELYIENKLEEARINSLNLGSEDTKLYKELIAFIKKRTKAEEELEKQIADDKALKERALALTQEIVLLQDYLDNLKKGVSIKKADNIAERERAKLSMVNQGLDATQIDKLLDLKEAIKDKTAAITAGTEAQEKQQKATEAAHADMLDTIQDYTADIISDWDNAGDMLVDIAKRTAAEMAAAFLTQQFIMPMVQTIGGSMGMSWNGVPVSAMGGMGGAVQAQQTGMGMPSGSALTWVGNNIPGMGALGSAMAWNIPGSAYTVGAGTVSSGMLAGAETGGASMLGTSLGTSLGYGAIGSLGYQYLGGALGLPQGKYSGLGAGVGGALGGTYAGAAMSAMGMAGAGAAAGSVVPVVGTIIGAVIGGLIGSLGGSKKEPKVGVSSGQWGEGHGWPGELNSDFGYKTWIQDVKGSGNRSEIGNAMMQVFDAQLQAIEDATSWGLKEALAGTSFESIAKFKDHDNDLETALTAMSDDVFRQINQSLVSAMGLSSVGLDTSFFEGLRADGETLLQTFARFATIAESIDDFSGRMNQQVVDGKTAEQAFGNLVVIAETLQAVTSVTDAIGTSSGINNVRNMIQAQSDYMKALKTVVATQDELAQVQIGISQQIGASISGLTADSLQSVLASGGDITGVLQATVKNTATQTIAGLASESIMAEYGNSLNQLIGDAFKNIN
ncbi:MAG: hypothetical protein LHW41_09595, partial [Candidatus Cloacimonetes bacterium]|nr:hypothetical protein [Candidatus Cloacimonadota bacterium]